MRILVVEDDKGTANILRMILENAVEAEVDIAPECATARDLLASKTYDMVTMDYQLPDGDGISMLEEVVAHDDAPPVVMVTGQGDERTVVSAFRKGASGYVVKDERLPALLVEQARSAMARADLDKVREGLDFERRQLLSIFDSIDEVIYISDPETYEILYANKAAQKSFGDVIGAKCHEALQGLPEPCQFCTNDRIFGEHEGEAYIWEFKNSIDGRWYRCIDRAIRWPDGRSVRYEMAIDINDVKIAAEAEKESEDKFEVLANTLPQVVYEYAADGLITYVNDVAFDMFGYTREDLEKGVYVLDIIDVIDHERVEGAIEKMMDGRSTGAVREYLAKRKDGSTFPIRAYTTLIAEKDGTPIGVRGLLTDITEEKEAERVLKEREARLSALFETMAEGLMFIKPDGTITYTNPASEELLGLDRVDLEQRKFDSQEWEVLRSDGTLMPTGEWAARRAIDERRRVVGQVMGVKRPDGVIKWMDLSASPIFSESGDFMGVVAAFTDITERRESRLALEAEQAFIEKVLNSLNDIFYVLSYRQNGLLVRWNKASNLITGYTDEELSRMTVFDFFDEEGREAQARFIKKLLEHGSAVIEVDTILKDGRKVPYQFRSTLMRDDKGEPLYVTGVGRDMTERIRAEEKLRSANAELEAYAGAVSHDLKGPLSSLAAASEFLERLLDREEDGFRTDGVRKVVKMMSDTSIRTAKMTDDLLELARAGQAPAASEPVEISRVIHSIMDEKIVKINERGVIVRMDPDIGRAAMDVTHAYQLFSNLIDNAIKYNDNERPEIRISKLGESEPGYAIYQVCDNGRGLPVGAQEEVFLPFHKGPESVGAGVGLSIVGKIVRLYGGQVSARNDGGACFEFTLPASP